MKRSPGRLRRVVGIVLVSVVALTLVSFVAFSWIVSGRLPGGVFEVRPPVLRDGIVVTAVGTNVVGDTLTLDDAATPVPALRRGQPYGLRWDGGSATAYDGAAAGDDVRVQVRSVVGSLPTKGETLTAFRELVDEPSDLPRLMDLEASRVTYRSDGHDLPAWVVTTSTTKARPGAWAVLVHGKGATPWEMARLAQPVAESGRTVLLIGYRNDADAWQDPSGEYAYGATEWQDLRAAVAYADQQGADDLVLGGASMGGAIVASYLAHVKDHTGLSGAVLDSPMLDLHETVTWGARHQGAPGPLAVAGVWLASQRYDVDWDRADYLDSTTWADLPVLVLHGDDDPTVPLSTSRRLADLDDDVRLEVFPDAQHVESWNADPARYDRLVEEFLAEGAR